jgi:heme/copper-type cytochrome/quinol oxidase subunit 2
MSPRRYKAFYYCNSVAFVASLVAIVLVRMKTLHHHNALEAAMILDLFGLIGAYAAGSCRDVSTSIYAVALAGAVLVYVVIHVVLFTLDHNDDGSTRRNDEASTEEKKDAELEMVKKRRKRLLLFAILAATITYQAGLTPPSGFLAKNDLGTGNHAGDPVLLNNYPRRYTAFFYCNSVSFMLSIALIILLVNPNLYRPAIQSNALSVCTAVGMMGIMGAYAAGSTQHRKTSIYIFALAGFVLAVVVLLVVLFLVIDPDKKNKTADESNQEDGSADEAAPEGRCQGHCISTSACFSRSADEATQEGRAADTVNPIEADPEAQITDAAAQEGRCQGHCISISACFSRSADEATPRAADTVNPIEANLEAQITDAPNNTKAESGYEKKLHAKRKYLMLLGILVAGITYQAGLAPPGGVWQSNDGGYEAGDPVMHDNRRHRYLAFFYSNSASFVASVVVIVLLLPGSLPASEKGSAPASEKWWMDDWWLGVMNFTIVLDLLGLLVAYAAGSSRSWKTSGYVSALVIAVLAYFVIHVVLSCVVRISKSKDAQSQGGTSQPKKELQLPQIG